MQPVNLRAPALPPILGPEDVAAMHRAALRVLDEVGLFVEGESLARRLAQHDGVRLGGDGRIRLDPWLVEQRVAEYRAGRQAADGRADAPARRIHLSAGCCANHIADFETGAVRPITAHDLTRATRLIDVLHDEEMSGHTPGFPQDVPGPLQALAEYLIGCENNRGGGSFTAPCSIEALEYLYEMHQVMGQPFHLSLYVINPLRIAGESLASILHFLDRLDGFSAGSMPLMGGTAPIYFAGGFVQAMAEALGGFVTLRLLDTDKPASFGIMAFPMDMQYGGIVYGSPEQNLADLIRIQVSAFYGMHEVGTRSIRSMAKRPGVQAAAEKAASAVVGALAGSRSFFGAGTLSVDEVWSDEQLVIDREIADYAMRVAQGFEFDAEALAVEIIEECVASGEFLAHPSTVRAHRRTYWRPRLMEHTSLHRWQESGEPAVEAEAHRIVNEKLARFDFALESEKARELHRIYDRAADCL